MPSLALPQQERGPIDWLTDVSIECCAAFVKRWHHVSITSSRNTVLLLNCNLGLSDPGDKFVESFSKVGFATLAPDSHATGFFQILLIQIISDDDAAPRIIAAEQRPRPKPIEDKIIDRIQRSQLLIEQRLRLRNAPDVELAEIERQKLVQEALSSTPIQFFEKLCEVVVVLLGV